MTMDSTLLTGAESSAATSSSPALERMSVKRMTRLFDFSATNKSSPS